MNDPFVKVRIGDPVRFQAQTWNAMLDAAQAEQRRKSQVFDPLTTTRSSTIIRVQNNTGNDLARNSIVGLDGPIITPTNSSEDAFLNEVTFSGITPDVTKHKQRYAVLVDPAPASGPYGARVVRAYLAGVCAIRIEVMDEAHKYAVLVDGSMDHLKSSWFGHARILWSEWEDPDSGYGYADSIQWAIVMLGVTGSCVAIGKANGTISARSSTTYGSGNVDLYRSNAGAEDGPIETIEVLNAAGDTNGAIANGKYVSVAWDADDTAWVAPLEC